MNMERQAEFEVRQNIAYATLNRPAALNSLNLEMARELLEKLRLWEKDPAVKVIVLQGAGPRSFCSGGDVKKVCVSAKSGDHAYVTEFFTNEYQLDQAIHESPKPIVVIGHGLVMGGGIGLMAGASCRIVTGSTVLAMPEISIGLFPDVGGTYFLNRMPGRLGLFLGLTATRLGPADAIFAGLADFFMPDGKIPAFLETLAAAPWTSIDADNKKQLTALAEKFSTPDRASLPANQIEQYLATINSILASDDPKEAFAKLRALEDHSDPVLSKAAVTFMKGSPTSAFVIFEQLRRGKYLSLKECFQMELHLALQFCRRHDFIEGVRALLIDKDQKPVWRPSKLEDVKREDVEAHFEPAF